MGKLAKPARPRAHLPSPPQRKQYAQAVVPTHPGEASAWGPASERPLALAGCGPLVVLSLQLLQVGSTIFLQVGKRKGHHKPTEEVFIF